jgi:hydrogenase maturation protease
MTPPARILVLGYGNPGRLDDGLGPACAAALAGRGLTGVTLEADYQLNVEDAELAAAHDIAVFVDAAVNGPAPFALRRLESPPANAAVLSFSTHSVSPAAVVALAREMFGGAVDGYVLAIRGYDFNEFGERLSPAAAENLRSAVEFLAERIQYGDFEAWAAPGVGPPACGLAGVARPPASQASSAGATTCAAGLSGSQQ